MGTILSFLLFKATNNLYLTGAIVFICTFFTYALWILIEEVKEINKKLQK